MNKGLLIAIFLSAAAILAGCKKDTVTVTLGNPNIKLQAFIDGSVWTPDTIATVVVYNNVSRLKTFSLQGTLAQKRVAIDVRVASSANTPGFAVGTYSADNAGSNTFQYLTQQRNAGGNLVFVQTGSVGPGSGSITISEVDSVARLVTGTFNLISRKVNLDASGNISSIEIHNVTNGVFNKLPYTYTAN